ncbi:glucose/quinate/shikimate family membrane-bound PQQ-dependent dehydrogenase [Phytohalomonas tamaricis]|uniref:glucose/quinate/shikimate family membrane-bound PQQ-dependent dehydrogenase n=1 Tax=Phytohalomonas tamaricis TaxID=2081032 RepID=UPI000D0BDB54|nr:glucose/quinate/shikimate family membrane-bound PQQ-dependent dehydrogenase [Phytohalomonas tamaricis]
MSDTARNGPKLPSLILGIVLLLLGLALIVGGVKLLTAGGSWYYLIAGIGILLSGILLITLRGAALSLYALVLFGTTLWALWEVGLDWWQLVPRVAVLCLIGIIMLLPWWRRPLDSKIGSLALSGAVVVAIIVAIASQFTSPHAIQGQLADESSSGASNPAQAAGDDWPAYGGTNAGTHYSTLKQITPGNADQLQEVWRFRTGDMPGPNDPPELTNENTPLKVNGKLYVCTPHSQVIALDPDSGKELWRFDPKLSTQNADSFEGWAHMTCRGVAYHDDSAYGSASTANSGSDMANMSAGEMAPDVQAPPVGNACQRRIFVPTADTRLIALNADTGEMCDDFGDHGSVDLSNNIGSFEAGGYYSTSPPAVTRDLVIIGGHVTDNSSIDEPSGVVRAYDVHDGHLVWNWDSGNPTETAPIGPDETYTRNSPNVWAPISVDESLGLVYLPMGNATPDQFGGNRSENDEKYSAALVALDLATGQVRWDYQFVHHDLWDMDTPAQPVLVDLQTENGTEPAVIQPTKQGSLYVLNRETGEPIVPINEVPAPQGAAEGDWAADTQPRSELNLLPLPLTGRDMWGATPVDQMMCRIKFHSLRYEGQYTPPSQQGSIVYPGNVGVFNWGGIAVDPERQAIFTGAKYLAFVSRLVPREEVQEGEQSATEQGLQPNKGAPYAVELGPLMSVLNVPCQAPPWGDVAGINLNGAEVAWMHRNGTTRDSMPLSLPIPLKVGVPALGGPLTTGGGVSFLSGTLDQYLRAYDITTGDELWKGRLPAGGQSTPMTYTGNDGRQYVLIVAGGHGTFGGKMGDYVIAYALPD